MALGAAMVDQARIYFQRPSAGGKVEGRTMFVEDASPWIKARLTLPHARIQRDSGAAATAGGGERGHARAQRAPTLMMLAKDRDGGPVVVHTQHRMGVVSKQQFGAGVEVIFEVMTNPEPIRKKRRVIGYTVELRRVEDPPLEAVAGV